MEKACITKRGTEVWVHDREVGVLLKGFGRVTGLSRRSVDREVKNFKGGCVVLDPRNMLE